VLWNTAVLPRGESWYSASMSSLGFGGINEVVGLAWSLVLIEGK